MCEESQFVKVDLKSGKSGLDRFRPPVTRRCEAAYSSVIKKAEVNAVVKTKEGAVAKQVVPKTLKNGISPPTSPGRSQNCPPQPKFLLSLKLFG